MIKRIFWDLDECLVYTTQEPGYPSKNYKLNFCVDGDTSPFYLFVRPCAAALIKFSRDFVGDDNVYILTTATQEYALAINDLADFKFKEDHIFTRKDIQYHVAKEDKNTISDKNNILIDNLCTRANQGKMDFIGIGPDQYLQTRDYFGVNFKDDKFEHNVKEFITNKNKD